MRSPQVYKDRTVIDCHPGPSHHTFDRAMASTEQLPAYVRIPSPEREPPSYEHTAFSIGTRTVSRPLVSSEQLKSHLRLLGMFALMKRKVQDPSLDPELLEAIPALAKELSPEERWVWFLELAVERCVLVTNGFPACHEL